MPSFARLRWRLYAPIYDLCWATATAEPRRHSLARLGLQAGDAVAVIGCGTGLDFAYLPQGVRLTAIDYTPAMCARARRAALRAGFSPAMVQTGDATRLPLPDGSQQAIVLHFVLANLAAPTAALAEARRVLAPGGRVAVLDTGFVGRKPGLWLRMLNAVTRPLGLNLGYALRHSLEAAGWQVGEVTSYYKGLFHSLLLERAGHKKSPGMALGLFPKVS